MTEHRVHLLFQTSMLLKGAHAVIECMSGIALALVGASAIGDLVLDFVSALTQQELIGSPHDFLASYLLAFAHSYSVQTNHFYAFYLLSHGIVNLLVVLGLLTKRLWSYPVSLAVLGLFVSYQLYRFSLTHGPGLIVLTVLDLLVMALTWHEYRFMRRHAASLRARSA
jgi:uncharacterized membrane protein